MMITTLVLAIAGSSILHDFADNQEIKEDRWGRILDQAYQISLNDDDEYRLNQFNAMLSTLRKGEGHVRRILTVYRAEVKFDMRLYEEAHRDYVEAGSASSDTSHFGYLVSALMIGADEPNLKVENPYPDDQSLIPLHVGELNEAELPSKVTKEGKMARLLIGRANSNRHFDSSGALEDYRLAYKLQPRSTCTNLMFAYGVSLREDKKTNADEVEAVKSLYYVLHESRIETMKDTVRREIKILGHGPRRKKFWTENGVERESTEFCECSTCNELRRQGDF